MKNFVLLFALILLSSTSFAQKENGTVYSEHESIEKTKALWTAFANGEKENFLSFFVDSVYIIINGQLTNNKKENMAGWVQWWSGVENLKIEDNKPAYPDAIVYDNGGVWVQDWLKFTGTHKSTGINLDLPFHNLYSFNADGKVTSIHLYVDSSVMDEINNSQKTIENGIVYINHPYIVTVRKLINAFCNEDLAAWSEFFDPKASFSNSTMKMKETMDLATEKKELEQIFTNCNKINMKQSGYPDCIYYAKEDDYTVFSWWILSYDEVNGGKKTQIPVMYSHTFNKEGKITMEIGYFSSNHFQ